MHQVGDILYYDWGNIQHPTIVCEHGGEIMSVSMDRDGALLDCIPGDYQASYRCRNTELARLAAEYARSWSFSMEAGPLPDEDDVAVNGATVTPYASMGVAGRFYGLQAHKYSGESATFEHDALYRAFKWAGRLKQTLSRNKGMTCTVFICSCYHAAAINLLYGGDLGKIDAKAKILGNGRSAQKATRAAQNDLHFSPKGANEFENSVLRAFSNVGAMPDQPPNFAIHWKSVLNDGIRLPKDLEEVFTSALLIDAKFTYGSQIEARMEADSKYWTKV